MAGGHSAGFTRLWRDENQGQPWTATLPTLQLLRDFGVAPCSDQVRRAVALVRDHCRWEHAGQPFFSGEALTALATGVIALLDGLMPPRSAYVSVYGMVRTTVYLPEELKAELERVAAAAGRTEAELIREGVRAVVDSHRPGTPNIPLFRSGIPDLAERADELLAGFGEA